MRRWILMLAGVLVASLPGPVCWAGVMYTVTDLGRNQSTGLVTFNATGGINPKDTPLIGGVRGDAGPYSTSYERADPYHINSLTRHAVSLITGGPNLTIDAVNGHGNAYDISTHVSAVNTSGTYVGTQYALDNGAQYFGNAIMYTRTGGTQFVPLGDVGSNAFSINNAGMIVGIAKDYAFLSDGKTSWDLNTLIASNSPFLLESATDIDDAGRILGQAYDTADGNRSHDFLLTPIAAPTPEPSSVLVLGGGLVLAGAARWHRRRVATAA